MRAALLLLSLATGQTPTKWEQLFFPFPIVGAPPQLEQQVQIFDSFFEGTQGLGDEPQAELAVIAAPHLGLVLTVPFQVGWQGQPTGFQDLSLLVQWLAAGSLKLDDMVSAGVESTFPAGAPGLTMGDFYEGLFVYGAQRFFHRLIFEGNVTGLLPVVHGSSARQVDAAALVSVLVTPLRAAFPVYLQVEADSFTYLDGTTALPPLATAAPYEVLDVAPELFLGPFPTFVSDGTRLAAGVSFNVLGDATHLHTYTLTAAFDIPNPYGY
ncbi:MAG TPA: hypothetical protein VMB50_11870 [Myxococcales bacterium]|nr:hypothetical protein [Myxococcales bacterium]